MKPTKNTLPICLFLLSTVTLPAADETDEKNARIDWSKVNTLAWDAERNEFIIIEKNEPVDWSKAERVEWDPESRRFTVFDRSEMNAAPGSEEDMLNRQFDSRNYQLSVRDQIDIQVFEEPDLSLTQRIDGSGRIRIPLLGNRRIAGMTVRQAEDFLKELYVQEGILRDPIVTVRVEQYAPKEISILGAVGNPGQQEFPIERNRLDIVDVVSRAGGFTPIAKSNAVHITRIDEQTGEEETFTINVEAMITGSRRRDSDRFYVYPGDVIWVPERIF